LNSVGAVAYALQRIEALERVLDRGDQHRAAAIVPGVRRVVHELVTETSTRTCAQSPEVETLHRRFHEVERLTHQSAKPAAARVK
jgi:hypothetical protein